MSLLSGVYAGSYYGGGYGGGSYGNKVASAGNYDRMAANVGSALSDEFSEVAKYFEMGKVDTAFDMYENLEDDVKIVADRYGYSLSDHEYETLLRNAYEHATNSSLDVTINDNTSSSFNTGYKQIISPFAWFSSSNTVSNEEAKARKAGNEASFSSQIHEGAGAAAAGATLGVAGTGIWKAVSALGKVTKNAAVSDVPKAAKALKGFKVSGAKCGEIIEKLSGCKLTDSISALWNKGGNIKQIASVAINKLGVKGLLIGGAIAAAAGVGIWLAKKAAANSDKE